VVTGGGDLRSTARPIGRRTNFPPVLVYRLEMLQKGRVTP